MTINYIVNTICLVLQALQDSVGDWPWSGPHNSDRDNGTGLSDDRHNYNLMSLPAHFCIGFARRRVGRGGRSVLHQNVSIQDFARN